LEAAEDTRRPLRFVGGVALSSPGSRLKKPQLFLSATSRGRGAVSESQCAMQQQINRRALVLTERIAQE
jgi:hypothetical protein